MAPSPEERFLTITENSGVYSREELGDVYDSLKPVTPEFMIGEWKGGNFDEAHNGYKALANMNFAGKTFHSTENVDPIMIWDEKGKKVCDERWGHARLREVKYRGVVSTAMVYDDKPIIDHFRYVTDNIVAGAMDPKPLGNQGTMYFFLTRE